MASLKENKHTDASASSTFMIKNYSSITSYSAWVLDTGCGPHICINMQAIRNHKRFWWHEVILQMGTWAKVATLSIGFYSLYLSTGLVIELSNCYYVPSIRKNIISVSCLVMDEYNFEIGNKGISIFWNDIFFSSAKMFNRTYILIYKA